MTTLQERFAHCRKLHPEITNAAIARCTADAGKPKISAAAVSKWFSGDSTKIKAEHVFRVARLYHVDPEWLATGRGKAQKPKQTTYDELNDKNRAFVHMYLKLPEDVRFQLHGLVSTLSATMSDRYAAFSDKLAAHARQRDTSVVHDQDDDD